MIFLSFIHNLCRHPLLLSRVRLDLGNKVVYTMCIQLNGGIKMVKTLIKHGNSLALIIDKPILEMLKISAETPLELSTDGDAILISPVRDKRRQKQLKDSLSKINSKFGDDLRRLGE